MALKQLERSIQLHRKALLEFQQWLETALQQFQQRLENITTVEKLIEHARPGEKYHKLAPLLMAVQHARASQFFKELSAKTTDSPAPSGAVDHATPKEDPLNILNLLVVPLCVASRNFLSVNDNSMVAKGKDEYATMNDKDRAELQRQHHDRIINFFNSCQGEHFTPSPVIIDCIMKKIVSVDGRYHRLRRRCRGSFVVLQSSRYGYRTSEGVTSEEDELYAQCKALATEHACLFELIDENAQFLKCFYMDAEQDMQIRSENHQEPTKLVKYLLEKIWDLSWDFFRHEMSIVEANERFVRRFSDAQQTALLGSDGDMEVVKDRYNSLEDNKKAYVEKLLNDCTDEAQRIVKRFNSGCDTCTHGTRQKLFHMKMKTSTIPNGSKKFAC